MVFVVVGQTASKRSLKEESDDDEDAEEVEEKPKVMKKPASKKVSRTARFR